jgi:hypothetical protein
VKTPASRLGLFGCRGSSFKWSCSHCLGGALLLPCATVGTPIGYSVAKLVGDIGSMMVLVVLSVVAAVLYFR